MLQKISFILVGCLLSVLAYAQFQPTVTTLDNGMEVILIENHASPMITSVVVVRAGSRHESVEMNGATHFLEHLLFNGTETRTQKQLYDEMDFLGGYNNANTTHDHTNFMILLEKSNFDKGLEIQADMLFHSTLPPDKFEKEKGIVIEEIGKDEDSESYRIERFFDQVVYKGTPYQRPILGSRQSIRDLTREQVWDYYKAYYVPNNMTALVMGDFDTQEMIELFQRVFGKVPPKALPKRKPLRSPFASIPTTARGEQPIISRGPASGHKIRYALPAPTRRDPEYFTFLVMTRILQDRLQNDLTARPELSVTDVSLDHFVDRNFGILNVTLSLNVSSDYQPALDALRESLKSFSDEIPQPEKVGAVITSIRSDELFNSERPHFYGMLKSGDLAQGGAGFFINYLQNLSRVKAIDVHNVAEKYLDGKSALVAVYLAGAASEGEESISADSRILQKELPNGLRVVIQENQDNPIFAAHFLFKHRSAYETALGGKPGMVDFIHHILDYGPKGLDKDDFQAELQKYGARVKFYDMSFIPYDDYYTTPEFSYVRLEALDDSYIPVLELLGRTMIDPDLTPGAVELVRGQMMGQAKRDQGSVSKSGKALFKSLLYGDSPLAKKVIGDPEDIASYTVEELRNFHQKYFHPGNLILTVLSSNNADSVMEQIERFFGDWSCDTALPAVSMSRPEVAAQRQEETGRKALTSGKEQSFLAMGYTFDLNDPADRAPLAILNYIISNRMQFQLREREGLAYTLGSSVSFQDGWGVWYATMGTGPQNLKRAEQGIIAEVRKAAKGNFTDEDVAKARNAYLGRLAMRGLTRINRAYLMGLGELRGEGIDRHDVWISELRSVKSSDVRRVARQYLKTDDMTVAIVR